MTPSEMQVFKPRPKPDGAFFILLLISEIHRFFTLHFTPRTSDWTMSMKTLFITLHIMLMSGTAFSQVNITFEQFKLDNGLTVILHEDHSAPVAAVTVMYHVGSKNEKPKRTGFAHLFEHVMFQGSANVADDEHFRLLQEVGGSVNGFTTEDGTTYYEVIPSGELELALYLESDRMGYLLSALTQEKLDNQRDVVKNERRQNYDNRPYGTASEKIARLLYPESHPYSWPVIGYMDDLSAASLEDVKDFFSTYYAPNNACLVLSGDVYPEEAKRLAKKYFDPIPMGKPIERPSPEFPVLTEDKEMVFEDKVQLPRFYATWHSVPSETREDAILTVLARILSGGKNSRLFKNLVYDRQIAQSAGASQSGSEIAGQFQIQVTAKPGYSLTEMKNAVDSIMADVIANGVTQAEIDKVLAGIETSIVNGLATVLGKSTALASYYSYLGEPGEINRQLQLFEGITPADISAAARKFLTKPRVMLSVVPLGKVDLAVKKIP